MSEPDRRTLYVHIGLHKTGSTFLQSNLFVSENGFHQFNRKKARKLIVENGKGNNLTKEDKNEIDAFVKESTQQGLVPILSHERFSGYMLGDKDDRLFIWERLKSLDYKIKIILLIREQKSLIFSSWKQVIRDGASISLSNYLGNPMPKPNQHPLPNFEYFDHQTTFNFLVEVFGKENVCILPFEMLTKDKSKFLKLLARFFGLDASRFSVSNRARNEALSNISVILFRFSNRFIFNCSLSKGGFWPRTINGTKTFQNRIVTALIRNYPHQMDLKWIGRQQQKKISEFIGDRYASQNQALSQEIGIDLNRYGY